jgi:hypothetical protein
MDWLFFTVFNDVAGVCNFILAGNPSSEVMSREISVGERPSDLQ